MLGVDEGRIRGGFPQEYEARIVEPQLSEIQNRIHDALHYRDEATYIAVTDGDGNRVVIRVTGEGSAERPACLFSTPSPFVFGVALQGITHRVDSRNPLTPIDTLDLSNIECAISDFDGGRQFLADEFTVWAFNAEGLLWRSRRVALDGIQVLTYSAGVVRGNAYHDATGALPFRICANTGVATGGWID